MVIHSFRSHQNLQNHQIHHLGFLNLISRVNFDFDLQFFVYILPLFTHLSNLQVHIHLKFQQMDHHLYQLSLFLVQIEPNLPIQAINFHQHLNYLVY